VGRKEADKQLGRKAERLVSRQAIRKEHKQAGKQQAGRKEGRQAGIYRYLE
jgi:hypothetical protein